MPSTAYSPIVQELVDYINDPSNSDFKTQFGQSFGFAYATGLDVFDKYNVHTLDDYFRFMNDFVYWTPTEEVSGRNVYEHICLFYLILDTPPVQQQQDPIDPSTKAPYRWLSDWIIRYAQEMGKWMDTPDSISPDALKTFYASPPYHMQDYPVPPGGWKTFNEFFARHIDPAVRPVAPDTSDKIVITSPADCSFDGTWPVDDTATLTDLPVKGVPWTISQLLADDISGTQYGPLFAGGVFTHSFLNTTDYHRQHAPVSGTVVEAKVIPGLCFLEVIVEVDPPKSGGRKSGGNKRIGMHRPITSKHDAKGVIPISSATDGGSLDAPDTAGYQFLQARGLILIDSPDLGLVAVLPIGMAQVSSVVLSVKAGDQVKKGDEISYFQLGGSDIVMVFQKDAQVAFEQEVGVHYNFGTKVATAPRK